MMIVAAVAGVAMVALQLQPELVIESRANPAATREAIESALRRNEIATARQLAAAYSEAWQDSFLVREVGRFSGWNARQRASKVWSDSVRRAGNSVYARDGADAGIRVWRRALFRARSVPDTAGIAAVLGNIGSAHLENRRLDSASVSCARARTLAAAVGDSRVQANAIACQAEVDIERGDLRSARALHTQALALHERLGDTRGIAADHNNLGLLAQRLGDNAEARRRFEAALALHTAAGRDDLAAINLVNLAGLATLEGDFATAQRAYRDALAKWRERRQWAETSDALRGLGQLEQRRGDYSAAWTAFAEALAIVRRTGSLSDVLVVQRDLAATLAAMGDLQTALDTLRRAQVIAESAHVEPDVRARIAVARADLSSQLNLQTEAATLYAESEALYRRGGDRLGEAAAQHGRALLLLEDNAPAAVTLLRSALRTQLSAPDERAAAITRIALGSVLREQGDTAESRRQLVGASVTLTRLGDRVASALALYERAELAAGLGARVTADSLYRAGLRELGARVAPDVAWRLHAGLAAMQHARGDHDGAVRELRKALAEIERPGRSLTLVERRSAFLTDKWEVYGQLALVEHERGRAAAAFEASERLRSREMLELLARARVTSPGRGTELWEREQDLRRRIGELTSGMRDESGARAALRGFTERPVTMASEDASALTAAQAAYAELLLEMRERAPRHADLVNASPSTWRDVAARLSADEAMIEYLLGDSASLAFVITRDTLRVIELAARRRDVVRLVEFARGTIDVPPPTASSGREDLWRGAFGRLYAQLVAPIEETGVLRAKAKLVIVPQGELHYLPFAALRDERSQFLVQRYEIAVTPSASVWLALGDRGIQRGTGLLALAPNVRALRGTQREVEAIDRSRTDAVVLTGTPASESAFRRDAPARRVIHLATYGVLNKQNPLFSFVELAADAAHDGRLEVHEVFGLSLAADLVVLSACQTALASGALADVPAGDDWVGLARAFLHAGAANVAATLWPVDDWSSALLMERFYERLNAGADAAASLAHAQRALLAAPNTAHPFYWAGFVVVRGDGGRKRGGGS